MGHVIFFSQNTFGASVPEKIICDTLFHSNASYSSLPISNIPQNFGSAILFHETWTPWKSGTLCMNYNSDPEAWTLC